jgi:acyl-CoA dehydrogenase-like protein
MDAAERALLEKSVRDVLDAAGATSAGTVDGALAGLGWPDMLEAEPRDAIAVVFEALGATNAPASALDDVVCSALGREPNADLAVVLPAFDTWDAPGRIEGDRLRAAGLATSRAARATEVLVVCDAGTRTVLLPATAAERRPVHGIDPDAGFHTVTIDGTPTNDAALDERTWSSAVALGRRAVSHQVAGASRAMLALAREHAMERVQFGRRIATFQAVRHRLAEALVAVEALDAALIATADEPGPETAALAKALAGRAARTVATQCQQVLAGIGFTTDHPFHRFLKRTMALDGLFGTADTIVTDVGRKLLETRAVPTLIEL